ncbi:hypothetical protein KY316_03790, partial [Candidatus Woesearchaeota archaeon]|nr:hypothetical protein [Candidatus Woesearchaeota archaeon]
DKELMANAFSLIKPTLAELREISKKKDPVHEPINIARAIDMLESLYEPLSATIKFSELVENSRTAMIQSLVYSFNTLPKAKAKELQVQVNAKLNEVFTTILRCTDFRFNESGVVGEAELKKARALNESMANGYFFHVSLEEEIKKLKFASIRERIPASQLKQYDDIAVKINSIKTGIERAHEHNMLMVNLAVLLYSYIKMLRPK